jgi:ribosomal-protein-alanine N-acetyltransferase
MDAHYRIRPAVLADAPALVAIERRCFGDPWSEASFREALTSAWNFVLVAQAARGVVGYLVGREAGGIGEVLNLAVSPEFRRRGVGEALLCGGLAAFQRSRMEEVFLEVRESNTSARALYARHGFRPVGQRSSYYRNPKEDALVLRLELSQPA